jgi:hypothetical protein
VSERERDCIREGKEFVLGAMLPTQTPNWSTGEVLWYLLMQLLLLIYLYFDVSPKICNQFSLFHLDLRTPF